MVGIMVALGRETNVTDVSSDRTVLLRMLDAFAEWLMRQELRAVTRARPCGGGRA